MKIGELAERSGMPASRIRFYESSGLLAGTQRGANGYREFKPQTLQTLEIIRSAQEAGFTLEDIRPLLPTNSGIGAGSHDEMLSSLKRKVVDIDVQQQRLKKNKAQLLAIIDTIENKPDDADCAANLRRVIEILRR